MLDTEQKRDFKRQGYVVLDDAFDESIIEEAYSIVWDALSISPDSSREEIQNAEYELLSVRNLADPDPFVEIRDTMFDYAEELVGRDTLERTTRPWAPGDVHNHVQIINNYPQPVRLPNKHVRSVGHGPRGNQTTASGHIDGYGGNFKDPESKGIPRFSTIGATVYLDHVQLGGGGFTVFPGSHWIAEKYFEDHSLESPGFKGQLPALDDDGGWNYDQSLFHQLRAKEVTGPAGTLLLRHMKLLHAASVNQRLRPRIAAVGRFSHSNIEEIKRDAASNIWKYWDGMRDIEVDVKENHVEL